MTGMPPPTAASKKSPAPLRSASSASSSPCAASIALFAVTTGRPARQTHARPPHARRRRPRRSARRTRRFRPRPPSRRDGEESRRAEIDAAVALPSRAIGGKHDFATRPDGKLSALPQKQANETPADHAEARNPNRSGFAIRRLAPPAADLSAPCADPQVTARESTGGTPPSRTVRGRTSSSSCAPCARRSGRRVRACARIRGCSSSSRLRCASASRPEPRAEAAPAREASSAARFAASAASCSALRLARSASRSVRASRIALRWPPARPRRDRSGRTWIFARNFSAIVFRAFAAAAWRSAKLLPFIKDIAFLSDRLLGNAGSCHSARKSAIVFVAWRRCAGDTGETIGRGDTPFEIVDRPAERGRVAQAR